MHMSYGKTRVAGVPNSRNQRAKVSSINIKKKTCYSHYCT
jgi:hypothetical protein